MRCLAEVEAQAAARLAEAGVEAPRRDARILLAAALGLDSAGVLAGRERPLGAGELAAFETLLKRRIAREPVSRILGRREFWSLEFEISPATLDPRPESETLIEVLLDRLDDRSRPYLVLDLGSGSGCLLLALLSELPQARGLGVDISGEAVAVAARNAARLGLESRVDFRQGDWGAGLESGSFDLLLCNPPYVAEAEWPELAPEVATYDPRGALLAGEGGLAEYGRLGPEAARLLAAGGLAVFEIGAGQEKSAASRLAGQGLVLLEMRRDLAGHPRCLLFGK